MTTQTQSLPYRIGKLSGRWYGVVVGLLILMGIGGYAYYLQFTLGDYVTGLRDIGTQGGAVWGLYVAIYVYLMGLSFAGITIAVLIRLFKLENLKPISRIAQVLAVVALAGAMIGVMVDIGQPIRGMINLFKYARPMSPFFGTFTLVIAGYMFASLVYLYLDGRRDAATLAKKPSKLQGFFRLWAAGYKGTQQERDRHQKASFWLAIGILPLMVTATSTLGFVFGLQVGRPGWSSALQAPGFVILASLSGVGMLAIIAALLKKSINDGRLGAEVFKSLSNLLMVLVAIYLYFTVVEWMSSSYTGNNLDLTLSASLVSGEYAFLFWFTIGLLAVALLLLGIQYLQGNYRVNWIVLCGLFVNLAAIGKRYLIIVPSQTHGTLLPYGVGSYSPTWVEYGVVLGIFAFGALLFVIFTKVFPIMRVSEDK